SAKSYLDIIPATRDIPERLDNRLSLSGPPGQRYTTHSDRRLNRFVLPPQARRLNNRLSLSGPPGRRDRKRNGYVKSLVKYPLLQTALRLRLRSVSKASWKPMIGKRIVSPDNRLSLSGPPGQRYTTHSDRRLNRFVLPPQARRLNNRLSLSGPPGR